MCATYDENERVSEGDAFIFGIKYRRNSSELAYLIAIHPLQVNGNWVKNFTMSNYARCVRCRRLSHLLYSKLRTAQLL